MIHEALEIFQKKYEEFGDKLIIDSYIPKDGTYILIDIDSFEILNKVEILYDKKKDEIIGSNNIDFHYIQTYDYYSNLLDMNKPMDPKKVIHSNQIYAFFIKKDAIHEKLKKEILKGYKKNILNPKLKYSKVKETLELYEKIEESLPTLDVEVGKKIIDWIEKNIYSLVEENSKEKNYLKLFFIEKNRENSIEKFKQEYKRYVIPNIYNSNAYNIKIDGEVYGLSNDNMGLNAKKPYLEMKGRKTKAPYLVSSERILLQKSFYDYLLILAKKGKNLVYFTDENIVGKSFNEVPPMNATYLLRISYSKNVEIKSFDIICSNKKKIAFRFEEVLEFNKDVEIKIKYGMLDWKSILETCSIVFFNGFLSRNVLLFNEELDIKDNFLKNIMFRYRESFYRWLYLKDESLLKEKLENLMVESVLFSLKNGYFFKVIHQINLYLAIEQYFNEGSNMMEEMRKISEIFSGHISKKENWNFINDAEYAYAVGQLLSFLNWKRNTKNRDATFLKEILPIKSNQIFIKKIERLFMRHQHNISTGNRKLTETIGNIMEYTPQSDLEVVTNYLIAGFCKKILFLEKGDVNNETNE